MRLDGAAIVRADLDVDADHAAAAHGLEEAGVEDERSAVGDARLDDDVGLHPVDHLLDAQHVLGKLDDGAAHPAERVDVLGVPAAADPRLRDEPERFRRVERMARLAIGPVDADDALHLIDLEHGVPSCLYR